MHYLLLASRWYTAEDPCPTVFGPLTPLGFRLFDTFIPGPLDLAAMAFETTCFALAMTLLYRLCAVYYGDEGLGKWSVAVTTLLPLSYFFQAPMSESVYLAAALGAVYCGATGRWVGFSLLTILATFARGQGVILILVGIVMLVRIRGGWRGSGPVVAAWNIIRSGWPLAFAPLGFAVLILFRRVAGLPPLDTVYRECSYVFVVNPVEGLLINLRWAALNPIDAIRDPDTLALLGSGLAFPILIAWKPHRRPAMLGYTLGHLAVFVSKINWEYGTQTVLHTQSLARYTLVLFPVTIMVADIVRRLGRFPRLLAFGCSAAGLLSFSAMYALGGGIP